MQRLLIAIMTFVVATLIGTWAVSAQTNTDTPSPTTTPVPQGAPQTGFGTVR